MHLTDPMDHLQPADAFKFLKQLSHTLAGLFCVGLAQSPQPCCAFAAARHIAMVVSEELLPQAVLRQIGDKL